jgi:hypothetical protein
MNVNATLKIIIGWVLVVAGLAVIGQTINSSYQFFSAKSEFPMIFKTMAAASQILTAPAATQNPQELAQAQVQQSMNQALGNVLPADSITKLLNIIAWSIFATLLVYAGGRIASLGIQLLAAKNS